MAKVIDKSWPQDAASKKARAIERAQARHKKRLIAFKKKQPKVPKVLATLVDQVPSLRKKINIQRKNPVSTTKKQIGVIKRQGGTIRFAKDLAALKKEATKKKIARKVAAREAKPEKKTGPTFKVCRMKRVYHTQLPLRKAPPKGSQKPMRSHTKLRKSLVPGTICILVAGRYQSKKVVFLKQLKRSGLCLVTGPYGINKVPLRRMDQRYMIATSVRIPLPEGFKVPGHVDDFFFKRSRGTKSAKTTKVNKTTLSKKKVSKKPDLVRKKAQSTIDKAVLKGFKNHPETVTLKKYMKRCFTLIGDRYAHKIKF